MDEDSQEFDPQLPEIPSIQWSASEFISHQKTALWYFGLGIGGAVMTALVVLVTRSIIPGIVVGLASVVVGIFAARKPATKQYILSQEGVRVDNQSYPYEMFKSFSIVEEGAVDCIWLRPLKRFMPTIAMYFAPEDGERIVDTLENFLPEEDRKLDTIDHLSRRIRF